MPDNQYVECFQSSHQNRRLSEKLKDRVENHAKQGNIKNIDGKENIIVNWRNESSKTSKYICKWLSEEDSVTPVYGIGDSHKVIMREEVLETELTV